MPIVKEKRKQERRDRLAIRNEKIREEFQKEWERGFRTNYIIEKLTKTYALDNMTLEKIVFKRDTYAEY